MSILSVIEADIITSLARYRYLHLGHMMRLRGVKTDKDMRAALRRLELAGMIGKRDCGVTPGLGRLPSCYWLRGKGARAFTEISGGDLASYPKDTELSVRHLQHQYLLLDAMVSLDLWAKETGQEFEHWGLYFMAASTELKELRMKSDGLAVLRGRDGIARPYVIEASRGEYHGGKRHALETLAAYLRAMTSGELSDAIWGAGDQKPANASGPRLLLVYDDAATHEVITGRIRRLDDAPAPGDDLWQRVFFKTKNNLMPFGEAWGKYPDLSHSLPDGLGRL